MISFLATAVSLIIGVAYGMSAGYLGGADALMMRIVDILYSLPFTIFVILLMVLFAKLYLTFRSNRCSGVANHGTHYPWTNSWT